MPRLAFYEMGSRRTFKGEDFDTEIRSMQDYWNFIGTLLELLNAIDDFLTKQKFVNNQSAATQVTPS